MKNNARRFFAHPSFEALAVRVVVWAGAAALLYLAVFCIAGSSMGSGHSYRVSPFFGVQLVLLLLLVWLANGVCRRWLADKAKAKRRLDLACALVCLWCFGLAAVWGLQGDFTPPLYRYAEYPAAGHRPYPQPV